MNKQILKGKVKDEEKNYYLNFATVSLFKSDSTLVSFQITDTYGAFYFNNIVVGQRYFVQISNIGYALETRNFKIDTPGVTRDLGTVRLKQQSIALNDVIVKVSPVTMNGDTLEFNPQGFKMEANAVAEDFLRKIPNITIWNDGQITVNGKEIKTLLVNGKPFFSENFKVATQNLPSNIIDKVQVYKKNENKLNPLDSVLEMNIKLKKGMNKGIFGKLSLGGGTRKRIDVDGNLNYYTKRMQVSYAGAANNTNKDANDISTLLSKSTYKSTDNYLDYQPDLGMAGLNRIYVSGLNFRYDFNKAPEFNNRSTLRINQFYHRKETDETTNNLIITTLNDDSKNIERGVNYRNKKSYFNTINANYDWIKPDQSFYINSTSTYENEKTSESDSVVIRNTIGEKLSNSNAISNRVYAAHNYNLNAKYTSSPELSYKRKNKPPFSLSYTGKLNESQTDANLKRAFNSLTDNTSDVNFDRKYQYATADYQHDFRFQLQNIDEVLFGYNKHLFSVDLVAKYGISKKEINSSVADLEDGNYRKNNYLSEENLNKNQSFLYGIALRKNFSKRLTERYEKSTGISVGLFSSDIDFNNTSSVHSFRTIKRKYLNLLPEASFSLLNNFLGRYQTTITSLITTEINIPEINQLAALVDSAQVYVLRIGNIHLKEEKIYSANTSFEYVDLATKNAFSFKIGGNISFSNNKILDSIFITPDNRQIYYPINASSYLKKTLFFEIRKSIKFSSSDLKFALSGNIDNTSSPTYINEKFLRNSTENITVASTIGYGINNALNIEFRERVLFSDLKQSQLNSHFSGYTLSHTLNLNFLLKKNISLNTNIELNSNKSTWSDPLKFTIWNAYLSYRTFKNNNGELKLSAIDMLNQNRNVVNKSYAANFATIYRNNLQRYLMISFSYYPRLFMKD